MGCSIPLSPPPSARVKGAAQHHHSGLQLLTPATVHYGQAAQLISKRQAVLDAAFQADSERFARRPPQHPSLPDAVWINPPASNKENTP
jgi:putative transposase